MTVNMFATLEQTTRLVDEGNPDEAYRVMKTAVSEDHSGFARTFLLQWARHVETEDENQQNKFAEILIFLRDDFPELATKEDSEAHDTNHAMPLWLAPLSKPEPVPTAAAEEETVFVRASPFLTPDEQSEPVVVRAHPEPVAQSEPETQEAETQEEEVTQEQEVTDEDTSQEPAVASDESLTEDKSVDDEETQGEPVNQEKELSDYDLLTQEIPDSEDEPAKDQQPIPDEQEADAADAIELDEESGDTEPVVTEEQPVKQEPEPKEEPAPVPVPSEAVEAPQPAPEPQQPVDNTRKPVEKRVKPVEKPVGTVPEIEPLTLTFYEWQMAAIQKAATKENVDEGVLLTRILQTRKLDPLLWSRYKQGKTTSPSHRITISVPHKTKVRLEKDKDAEGIKTTTKFVRKVLFGTRAEKA